MILSQHIKRFCCINYTNLSEPHWLSLLPVSQIGLGCFYLPLGTEEAGTAISGRFEVLRFCQWKLLTLNRPSSRESRQSLTKFCGVWHLISNSLTKDLQLCSMSLNGVRAE